MGISNAFGKPLVLQRRDDNRMRVLVVDDNARNRVAARATLALWGIEPDLARDGMEAVNLVATQTFDFVLMDIVMPVMDGYAATTCIRRLERADPSRLPVPVVAYSSSDVPNDPEWLRALGFSEAVMKPSTPERMKECLLRWCPDKFLGSVRAQADAQRARCESSTPQ